VDYLADDSDPPQCDKDTSGGQKLFVRNIDKTGWMKAGE
jgi:hypothetical protein